MGSTGAGSTSQKQVDAAGDDSAAFWPSYRHPRHSIRSPGIPRSGTLRRKLDHPDNSRP